MDNPLHWIRRVSTTCFYHFGVHCATHQIRLILISGLVITSLFYPALAIYSSTNSEPLSFLSSKLRSSLDPDNRPLYDSGDDVSFLWSGKPFLRIREDPVVRARCGMERTVRVERVFVRGSNVEDAGAINLPTLLAALKLENQLTRSLSFGRSQCLTTSDRRCLTLSPLAFWSHSEQTLRTDEDLLKTLNTKDSVSVSGLPLTPTMTLAGYDSFDHSGYSVDFASHLAITYFFVESDCLSSSSHNSWLASLELALGEDGDLIAHPQEPVLLALEFNPDTNNTNRISVITAVLYLSYVVFFVFFSGSMSRMNTVHSRIGLCFTGLIEILCSTITSLSVCALGGLKITMVPWSILPIVIVFVGAENMFRLIDEVVKTSINRPVKDRIGEGLGRAGTSNTLKVVTYNSILGVIAFFASGAIRQFCVFAIVVLVAHWFLIHTFFVAVLSIDLQRLELHELIRQDINIAPSASNALQDINHRKSKKPVDLVVSTLKGMLRGRATKNASLLLLLAITGTLYYSTLPSSKAVTLSRASSSQPKPTPSKSPNSGAWQLWRVLNPNEDSIVHLRIEAPVVTTFKSESEGKLSDYRYHRSRLRTLRPLLWLFKIMVLPIGATIGILYAILLYLLKDTDRLENRAETGKVQDQIEDTVLFKTLPRVFATDIAHLAATPDGKTVLVASLESEVKIWNAVDRSYTNIDTVDLLSNSSSPNFTSVAVEDGGKYCAVGTGGGVIAAWGIQSHVSIPLPHLLYERQSPVSYIQIQSGSDDESRLDILATYEDGTVRVWTILPSQDITKADIPPPSSSPVLRSTAVQLNSSTKPLFCFELESGSVSVHDYFHVLPSAIPTTTEIPITTLFDPITHIQALALSIENSNHVLIAMANQSGVISLWDLASPPQRVALFDEVYAPVTRLQLSLAPPRACVQCGENPLCSFALSYSMGHVVVVERADLTLRCSCPVRSTVISKAAALRDSAAIGRRSRNSSFISSSPGSALRMRNRVSSLTSPSHPSSVDQLFPVSGHGAHSRRASDSGTQPPARRSPESQKIADMLSVPLEVSEGVSSRRTSLDGKRYSAGFAGSIIDDPSSPWRNLRFVRIGEVTCERGGWGVVGPQYPSHSPHQNGTQAQYQRIVGLRRRPRLMNNNSRTTNGTHPYCTKPSTSSSLSTSALDRWELWLLDPLKVENSLHSSPLSRFQEYPQRERNGSRSPTKGGTVPARLPFTRLTPLTIGRDFCVAGFGNTTGILAFSTSSPS